jgi:hypothetical protein
MAGRQVIFDNGGAASTIAKFLKESYVVDSIRNLVNTKTELLSRIKSKPTEQGLYWVEPLQTAVSQGNGARAENASLPNPGFMRVDRITGNAKSLYGTFYITGQSIATSKGSKAAFRAALELALNGTKEGFKLDKQRQSWGDGSAVLAVVDGAHTAQTTIAVSDPYGLTYVQADLEGWEKVLCLKENQPIWFYTTGGGGTSQFRTITGVNEDAGTITVDSAVTLVDGDLIILGSSSTSNNMDNELTGISGSITNTGSYFGLSRTGRSVLQSKVVDFTAAPYSGDPVLLEKAMRGLNSTLFRKATDSSSLAIFCNTNVHDTHVNNLTSERRQVNPMELKSGQDAVEYAGKPMVKDKDCPPQRQYWLRMDDIFFRTLGEQGGSWIDDDGNMLHRVTTGEGRVHAFMADWVEFTDMVTRAPANHGVIEGITRT